MLPHYLLFGISLGVSIKLESTESMADRPRYRPGWMDMCDWTCVTGQRAQKEWVIKASGGRVERETAAKCTQC